MTPHRAPLPQVLGFFPTPFPAHLDQGGVEEDVMGHDDGPHHAHGLQQLLPPAARAVGQENAPQHLQLRRPHHHVLGWGTPLAAPPIAPGWDGDVLNPPPQILYLVAKGQGHDGDEEAEESLQLAEPCGGGWLGWGGTGAAPPGGNPLLGVPTPHNSPYLSRKRKRRVSAMVMRTPPQSGMLRDGDNERGGVGGPPISPGPPLWGEGGGTPKGSCCGVTGRLRAG